MTALRRSFFAKLSILATIFILVPIILYNQIKAGDEEKNALLRDSLAERGRLIAEALRPALEEFESQTPAEFHDVIARLGDGQTNLRLLYRSRDAGEPEGYVYVATSPAALGATVQAERWALIETGVLDELDETCERANQRMLRFTNPAGREEILTSLTPLNLANGCWVVTTSNEGAALLESSFARPFWKSAYIQIAVLIYFVTAGLICWLIADIWRGVSRFRGAARAIRLQGVDGASFSKMNRIPELSGVAEDFDALVSALGESQDFIRRSAEESAHALKAPLAVISQAVEPLKRAVPNESERAHRSLDLIERSVARLSALVGAARDLDKADADVMFSRRRRLNVSELLKRLLSSYEAGLLSGGKRLEAAIEPGVIVLANEDMLEPIVENLLENAVSFAPPGTAIEVALARRGEEAELSVRDCGPGVDPDDIGRIFERYYSRRPPARGSGADGNEAAHFGLGLWIVKRNAEGLGGRVDARNRPAGGFSVTVTLPVAARRPERRGPSRKRRGADARDSVSV